MPGTIEIYGFERADGSGSIHTTRSPMDAKKYAQANGLRVVAHTYELTDSELVEGWDFTGVDEPS